MNRPLLHLGLVVVISMTGVIVGCSDSHPEGDLPQAKVAAPGDMEKVQKELLQQKVADGAKYTKPPGVQLPR